MNTHSTLPKKDELDFFESLDKKPVKIPKKPTGRILRACPVHKILLERGNHIPNPACLKMDTPK